jgi:hypothetical protein
MGKIVEYSWEYRGIMVPPPMAERERRELEIEDKTLTGYFLKMQWLM